MMLKSVFTIAALLLASGLFFACKQKQGTTETNETLRIPVSVQDSSILSLDKSPMDMIYFPEDYPKQKMVTPNLANPVARVIYSRPQKNERVIFADSSVTENVIQHYGKEWRLGANEATELNFLNQLPLKKKKLLQAVIYFIAYLTPINGK